MKHSDPASTTSRVLCSLLSVGLAALVGCTSAQDYNDRAIDVASTQAVNDLVASGTFDTEVLEFSRDWEPLAYRIGRAKGEAESNGQRLDLVVALEPVLERFPDAVGQLWVESLSDLEPGEGVSTASVLAVEMMATVIVVANDEELALAFGERAGERIDFDELSVSDLGVDDPTFAQSVIIKAIKNGAAESERLAE